MKKLLFYIVLFSTLVYADTPPPPPPIFVAPLVQTGRDVNCNVASGSQAGCLSASDWTRFNSASGFPGGSNGSIQYNNSGVFGGFGSYNGTLLSIPSNFGVAGTTSLDGGAITTNGSGAILTTSSITVTGRVIGNGGAAFVGSMGFFGTSPIAKPTGDVLSALANLGLINAPVLTGPDISNNGANTTGTAFNITSTNNATLTTISNLQLPATQITGQLPIAHGGTGQATASAAINALLPTQTGNNTFFLQTDGTNVSWQSAAGGIGTVTSVGLALPSIFNVTNSPVTTNGTLTATFNTQSANTVFSGPSSGSAAAPTFRALVSADIPSLSYVSSVTATAPVASTGGLTPVISISKSTTSTDGYLSSVDWNTFNGKQAALTFNTPLSNTSNTISISQSGASTNGYLSSADWNTFNNKGSGSVTSVALVSPSSIITTTGSPITTTGTLTQSLVTQTANTFWAGPLTGSAAAPTFRVIDATDVPTLNQNTTGTASNITATSNSTLATLPSLVLPGSQVTGNISGNAANVTGTVAIANGGTGQITANAGFNALAPSQTGNTGEFLTTDGTNTSWSALQPSGVSSVTATAPILSSGGSNPNISCNVASGSQPGCLASSDFSTFSAKQSALTFTTPLVNTSGTVTINQSGTITSGYLSSTDWNTFNSKQPAGSYITSLTGDVTASGPGSSPATLTAVTNSTITTLSSLLLPFSQISGGTSGSVIFSNGSGLTENNSNFYWDNAALALGIGTIPASTAVLDIVNNSGSTKAVQTTGYGSNVGFRGRRANGTLSSPTGSLTGDVLSFFSGRGYGATGFGAVSTAAISVTALENFSDTAQGTSIAFNTTAAGQTASSLMSTFFTTGSHSTILFGNGFSAFMQAGQGPTNGNQIFVVGGTSPGAGGGGAANLDGGASSATSGSNGGAVNVAGGDGSSTGSGGSGGGVTITSGNGLGDSTVNNSGGSININAGSSVGSSAGAPVGLKGGVGGPGSATAGAGGGPVNLTGGIGGLGSATSGVGGTINITGGTGGAGVAGGNGGGTTIQGGTAGLGSSTPGNGGVANLEGGLSVALDGSAGGGVNVIGRNGTTTATGGAGGAIAITGGAAGGDNTVTRQGGAIALTAGVSKGSAAGGGITSLAGAGGLGTGTAGAAGGAITQTSGAGGVGSATSGTGGGTTLNSGVGGAGVVAGNGGSTSINSGAGGIGTTTSGTGGATTINSGAGGSSSVVNGAPGGATTITSGVGGASTAAVGGVGGATSISAGNGGNGSTAGGNGGTTNIRGGAAGTGGTGVGGAITFQTAATTSFSNAMSITNAQQVGIGTLSPSTALQVVGTVTATAFAGTLPAADLSGTVAIANGGTAATTATAALTNLLPSQTSNAGKFLETNGTTTSWATVSGSGTVTSVALALPSFITVSGSPITTTGTLTGTLATQSANTVFAGPTTGAAAAPTFRALVSADVPTLNQNTTGTAANITATSNSTLTTLSALSLPGSQVTGNISGNATNVTGTVAIANGGTGQTTASTAFNNLSPMNTLGDTMAENSTPAAVRVAGNTTSTKMFYTQTGTGAVSALPTWSTIIAADVPLLNQNTTGTSGNVTATVNSTITTLSALSLPGSQVTGNIPGNSAGVTGTVNVSNGGTGITSTTAFAPVVGGTVSTGSFQSASSGMANVGFVLTSTGATSVPTWQAASGGGITALTGDVTASGTGSVAAMLTATTNSTLTTLSALSLPGAQVTGNIAGTAANITATSNATITTLSSLSLPISQLTGTLPIANGGTGQTTAANAINALLPSQTGQSGNFLTTNGTVASWSSVSGSGANTALSNLTSPTALNEPLIASTGGGTLADSSAITSVDWNARSLLEADGTTAMFWSLRQLYSASNQLSIDWTAHTLSDSGGTESGNYSTRQLTAADGTTPTINWGSAQLNDTSNLSAIQWDVGNRFLIDNTGAIPELQWGSGIIASDEAGVPGLQINSGTRILLDSSNASAVDFNNRILVWDDGATPSVQWDSGLLTDAGSTNSVDWTQRQLIEGGGTVAVDWSNSAETSFNYPILSNTGGGTRTPTPTVQSAAGTGGSAFCQRGGVSSDNGGWIQFGTGIGATTGEQCRVIFFSMTGIGAACTVTPEDAFTAAAMATKQIYITTSTNYFSIKFGVPGTNGDVYNLQYTCIGLN